VARLIYSTIASLDGYVADADGDFDWAAPDEEVHAFVNELERPVGTCLYGRRMYEVMTFWETLDTGTEPQVMRDFAEIWRAADKVVYSRTLGEMSSAKTRLEREFDPDAVRELVASADRDVTIGGPVLAAEAFKVGLIDECQMFLAPVVVGAGKRSLPAGVFARLELLDQRRFDSGFVYLRYGVKR
jgi:dihydrofolate reductase